MIRLHKQGNPKKVICKKTNIKAMALSVLLVLSLWLSTMVSAAELPRTIRVGYFDYAGFIEKKDDDFVGYGVDLLDEVAKYTGWRYEFVYDSWENLVPRLEKGNIDLLCTMQNTPERSRKFDFCTVASGLETATLCVKDGSEVLFNDFEAFNGMKIGFLEGSYQNILFQKYAEQNDFDYIPINFSYMKNMEIALQNGEIDAYAVGGLSKEINSRIVANFSVDPFYFVTNKNNEGLMAPINDAMCQILNNKPDFITNLYKQYYENFKAEKPVFTKEEVQFIKEHPSLKVAFNHSRNTPGKVSLSGVLYDTMELVSKKCGIDFEYIQPYNYAECFEMIKNGSADIVSDVYHSKSIANEYGIRLTDIYYESPFVFIGKRGMTVSEQGHYTLALEKDLVSTDSFIKHNYPNTIVKYFDNENACNEALVRGETDLIIQKYEMAPHYLVNHQDQDITIVSTSLAQYAACFGVSDKISDIAVSILNKAIHSITDSDMEYISISNNTAKQELTFSEMLIHYLPHIAGIILFSIFITLAIYLKSRHSHTEQLKRIAYRDPLTGSDNIASFNIKAEKLLHNSDKSYAIVVLDINKFKAINDMYGYEVGDTLLVRMNEILMSSVFQDELLARDVADRFVMLLEETDAHILCERIESMMNLVTALSDDQLKKSVFKLILSCGVCHINKYIPPITSYIDHAYLAARTIKNSHRSSFAVYDTAMLESLNHEKELENIMDNAIRNHEFKVYMQPRIDLATQRVAGSEALVRWQLPDDTMIMPDSFIPLFEKNGFIESVDFYMLTSVCEQIRERLDANEVCLPVSINQSRFLFYQKDYYANVCEILERYNIPTSFIELEITESLFLDPNEDFVNILNALRAKGISISLDDFGSGYSSLNMLRNIPLDIIKIDRDFLRVSDEANTNRILIRKIVELASELNIKVVCEGVETEEQMHFLESIGCDYAQGFYYSRPIPCEQFIEFTNNFNK